MGIAPPSQFPATLASGAPPRPNHAVFKAELVYVSKPFGGARGGEGVCTTCTTSFSKKKSSPRTTCPKRAHIQQWCIVCRNASRALGGAHKWAEMLHHPCILRDPQREGDKIRIGGAHRWAEMLHHPCILRGPQSKGDKIRIGGAHKWAEMLHHQGGQNQNWMPKPCLLGGPQVGRKPAFSGIPNKENKVKTKKKQSKKEIPMVSLILPIVLHIDSTAV